MGGDGGVGEEFGFEVDGFAFLQVAPELHRVGLDEAVGVFAADSGLGECQQHALREVQAAEGIQIFFDAFAVDGHAFDKACEARQGEVQSDGRVGAEDAFDGGV